MLLFRKNVVDLTFHFRNVRFCSSTSLHCSTFNFDFSPKFSNEDQERILTILNASNHDQLLNLNVPKNRIKSLETYRNKKGPFRSLNEILEVDGLSVKMVEKMCEQIISDPTKGTEKPKKNNKRHKQLLTPSINGENQIKSPVGIHLGPTGVSWAKFVNCDHHHLQCWNCKDFGLLPKKLQPHETFLLAREILHEIPVGDAYVFEATPAMSLQGQNQPTTVTTYNQQLELTSMLLALINTCPAHNLRIETERNVVFFLKSKVPARLFKTLVGNERVSTSAIVSELIGNVDGKPFAQPCTPIRVDTPIKNEYLAKTSPHKELLGQALLLLVAFYDLCIIKKTASFEAIMPRRS